MKQKLLSRLHAVRIQIRDDVQNPDLDWVKGVSLEAIRSNEKVDSFRKDWFLINCDESQATEIFKRD